MQNILPAVLILGYPAYFLYLLRSGKISVMIEEHNRLLLKEKSLTRPDVIFNFFCYYVAILLGVALGMDWIPSPF